MLDTEGSRPKVFTENRGAVLTKPATIRAEYKANANLLFSSGLKVRLEAETSLIVWTAEQDVAIEADGTVRTIGDDVGIVLSVKLEKGRVHFQLPTAPNSVSSFTFQTDHAELEVHATSFSVAVSTFGFTKVRCYDGYLLATTKAGKVERIENEEVAIHGDEALNTIILRSVAPNYRLYTWPTEAIPTFRYDNKTKTFVVQSILD